MKWSSRACVAWSPAEVGSQPRPPALTSAAYARDLNQVKAIGAANGTVAQDRRTDPGRPGRCCGGAAHDRPSVHDYVDPDGRVKDQTRIDYLRTCVESIARAVDEGVDVRGLYVWSLLDNLEWDLGYAIRFGLFYVDYRTQQRVPKDSAYWYRRVIAEHTQRSRRAGERLQ